MIIQQQNTPDRLAVSVEEAAAMSGLGRTTIYKALGDGSLRSLKIGKRRLIEVEALRQWIAGHQTPFEAAA